MIFLYLWTELYIQSNELMFNTMQLYSIQYSIIQLCNIYYNKHIFNKMYIHWRQEGNILHNILVFNIIQQCLIVTVPWLEEYTLGESLTLSLNTLIGIILLKSLEIGSTNSKDNSQIVEATMNEEK